MNSMFLISALIILACFSPFIYISYSNRRRRNAMIEAFRSKCAPHQLSSRDYSVWSQSIIGLSSGGDTLLFQQDQEAQVAAFSLADVSNCTVEAGKTQGEGYGGISKVELVLTGKKSSPAKRILFFDSVQSLNLGNEYILANEWAQKINTRIAAL